MVLTRNQAHSLYQAMINCNDIEASFRFTLELADGTPIIVDENPESGTVRVWLEDGSDSTIIELYENQPAFAQDYGISPDGAIK